MAVVWTASLLSLLMIAFTVGTVIIGGFFTGYLKWIIWLLVLIIIFKIIKAF